MERLLNNNHDGIDLPACIIVELLPFVDRETWNNLILTNRAIYQASKQIEPPWPRGKFSDDHERIIRDVTFSSDGTYFLVLATLRGIRVWHQRIGPYAVLCPTNRPANRHLGTSSMASSPTENLLVTATRYEFAAVLQFWDIASLSVVNELLIPDAALTSCVFSPDGRLVVCSDCVSRSVHICSASDATCIKTISTNGHLTFGGFSPDNQTIVAGFNDRLIRVWDVAGDDDDTTFENLGQWAPTKTRPILSLSPQGQSLIIGTASANVCKLAQYQNSTWVVKDLHLAMEVNSLHFVFSPGGRLLAARKIDGILELWDPVAGKLIQRLGECLDPTFLAFSGDGKMLAAIAEHRHVSLWPVGI
jgi:WD40 repeat protein